MPEKTENALARTGSAYLRSAMHQPVQWREWGEEAFAAAQQENKPVLLDIGAVWCHWCHVMDRESYENAETARLINENFVPVKVDRDERPDVDARYQAAVQALSGQGGWPLTAFLTPDGRPFYGGTYFPPADQFGRPGFPHVLQAIAQAYRERPKEVLQSAESIMSALGAEVFAGRNGTVDAAVVEQVVDSAKSMFDSQHGGFGNAPKFPHPGVLDLLIDYYARTGSAAALNMFVTTLEQMARGGVYDQLGGGFHRYSTDERWVVPHFEKMSYDNSELLKNYVHAWQATGIAEFAAVAKDVIRWMDSWLSDREHGGFYASQDADISLDDDGDYFTWSLQEARATLGTNEKELEAAALHYDINEIGEMHHNHLKNVLFQRADVEEISRRMAIPVQEATDLLRAAKQKLYDARCARPAPYIDRTVYSGWNALCITSYLQAARALGLEDARRFALRSLDRLLAQGWSEGELKHVIAYAESDTSASSAAAIAARGPAILDDYAYVALACLEGYETTADITYFQFAGRIADAMIDRFYDHENGGFFDIPVQDERRIGALAARRKPFQDAPTPAGNSSAVIALLRLHAYTNDARYRELARKTLEVFAGAAGQFGIFGATYAIAVVHFTAPHTQVLVAGNDELARELEQAALRSFTLNKSVIRLQDVQITPQNLPPALAETIPNLPAGQGSIALLCSGFACRPPVNDPAKLASMLREVMMQNEDPSAA